MPKRAIKLKDESADRKYFIMTPQLVWALSRDNFDLSLWTVVKMIAGESGECMLAAEDLAILAMMSVGKLVNCRTYLLEQGLLEGELRKDPGYPQSVWHLRVPNLWLANIAWRDDLGHALIDRIAYKKQQKRKRLHQVKPSPGEEGPSPGEEGPSPGEAKNIHKENPQGEPAMRKADPLSFDLERQTATQNWAVPLEAGGDDEWENGPVDAFASLVGLNTLYLPKKRRHDWALALKQLAASWSTEHRIITPQDVVEAIEALPDSPYSWKTFSSPFEQGFQNTLAILLLGEEASDQAITYGIEVQHE